MVLPFVDHDRCWGRRQPGRISLHEFERRWIGEIEKRGSPPPGCAGFPNALWALDGDGGEATKEFTKRAVHGAMQVFWGRRTRFATFYQIATLPFYDPPRFFWHAWDGNDRRIYGALAAISAKISAGLLRGCQP